MHIGFRYHIASLIAVFFSLVLGMLIGSALFQNDGLVQEQGYIISDLENRFKALEVRTKTLQENLDLAKEKEAVLTALWDQVKGMVINEQLHGFMVAIYSDEDLPNLDNISCLLTAAGASYLGSFQLPLEETQLAALLPELDTTTNQPIALIYSKANELDLTNLEYLQNNGWQLCIIQPYDAALELSDLHFESLVIAGIDTPIGELALIQGLSQSLTGKYGWGKGFASLLPNFAAE